MEITTLFALARNDDFIIFQNFSRLSSFVYRLFTIFASSFVRS